MRKLNLNQRNWEIVKVENYIDSSWGHKIPSTTIYYKNKKTGAIKADERYGETWKLEDLKFAEKEASSGFWADLKFWLFESRKTK